MCVCCVVMFGLVSFSGEFGTVYRAVWKEQGKKQVEVAVKTLKVRGIGQPCIR